MDRNFYNPWIALYPMGGKMSRGCCVDSNGFRLERFCSPLEDVVKKGEWRVFRVLRQTGSSGGRLGFLPSRLSIPTAFEPPAGYASPNHTILSPGRIREGSRTGVDALLS